MKKVICILIVLLLVGTTAFVDYNNSKKYNPNSNIKINYNNICLSNFSDIWATNENFYYADYSHISRVNKDGEKEILITVNELRESELHLSENESAIGYGVQAFGDYIYFMYSTSNAISEFYRMDKNTLKYELIYDISDHIDCWTILNNRLIFTSSPTDFGHLEFDLQVVDLVDNSVDKIASKVVSFGIVNEKIRYIKHNYKTKMTRLYEYSVEKKRTELIGGFSGKAYNAWFFNYTDEKVILFKKKTVFVYDINTKTVTDYKLENKIENMSCYGNSAFIQTETDDGESKIYHLHLKDCNLKQIYKTNNSPDVFCANEDSVFVVDVANKPVVVRSVSKDGKVKRVLVL